jgi:acetyl esterase
LTDFNSILSLFGKKIEGKIMGKLHPEMRKVLDQFEEALREFGLSDFHSAGVEPGRTFFRAIAAPEETYPGIYHLEKRKIAGPGSKIPIRIYYPFDGLDLPAMVWFHGGGWVLGDLECYEFQCRKMANDYRCVVISVEYRLAPETPFPGAIDDAYFATEWVIKNAVDVGINPQKIAVGGDSAGGNLAACVALRARDNYLPIRFQLLVYPAISADFNTPSCLENATGYLLSRDALQWFWDCYVPDPEDRKHPYVSPIHAENLSGLAPALIITAEFDPLRDEGEAYGEALTAAGVDVEVKRYPGMIHGFYNMLTEEPVEQINSASVDTVRAFQRVFGTS